MKQFISLLVIISILQAIFNPVFSQGDWSGIIYKDTYVTVELLYKMNNPCMAGGGRSSKYSYVINGSSRGSDLYLNWKMDYYDCNNNIVRQTNSVNIGNIKIIGSEMTNFDWIFPGPKLITPYYKDSISVTRNQISVPSYIVPIPPKSKSPTSIAGNLQIDYGDVTNLKAMGGALGLGAEWKWYTGNCGVTLAGTGESIDVNPTRNTEYFVRAESPSEITACFSVRVVVNPESRAADHIEGKKFLCRSEKNTTLTVNGGKLGENADWVWYQDNTSGPSIGKGKTIMVAPTASTTYFVRAEGAANITAEKSISIKIVDEKLSDPASISGESNVCKGATTTLRVTGIPMPETAEWHWYRNNIISYNHIGKGESINIVAEVDATYYVRGEGTCNTTKEQSILVKAIAVSIAAQSITDNSLRTTKRRIALSVNGGFLGVNAEWKWYKNNCNGRSVGNGKSISVRVRKKTYYYVRAEGQCNTTMCASTVVWPNYNIKHFFVNFGVIPSFHFTKDQDIAERLQQSIDKISENPVIGVTFGSYKENGWYVRGKYSLRSKSASYKIENNEVSNPAPGNYYVFNNSTSEKRLSATAGWIRKLNKNSIYFQLGAGYGERSFFWGVDEYSNQNNSYQGSKWAKVHESSFSGIEAEAGIMLRFLVFNITGGVNAIIPVTNQKNNTDVKSYKTYMDAYVGFGFTF